VKCGPKRGVSSCPAAGVGLLSASKAGAVPVAANATGLLYEALTCLQLLPPAHWDNTADPRWCREVPSNHSDLIVTQCVGFPTHDLHAAETVPSSRGLFHHGTRMME
jgi:hypothetical protein